MLLAGVLLILLPIFTLMTIDRLTRQKELFTQRLIEKGMFLIRTFEAGTRTGMLTMHWGAQRIQTMLYETALQPDVVYLMITTKDGQILAHSDASMVGQIFDAMPEMNSIDTDGGRLYHRLRHFGGSDQTFEVYKRFVPVRSTRGRRGMRRHMRSPRMFVPDESLSVQENRPEKRDWSQAYTQSGNEKHPGIMEHYIFAGLSMEKEQFARTMLLKQTIFRGLFFFALGCVGMVALFSFQAYRGAKASLNQVRAFSDNVIHHMPSGLITLDMDHRITSMNQTAKLIFGKTLDRPFVEWVKLIEQIDADREMVSQETYFELDGGQTVLLDTTASPIVDEHGQTSGYLFLFKDLTQIKELKLKVETNKRLAAIGKLAAGVAHEIRNPLSSIKGFATYFGKRYPDNETDRQTAQIMVSEVERINQSITQLLEFARPMALAKKQVNIKQMIHHSLKLVQYDLDQKQIASTVTFDTRQDEIYTDESRMNQVLLNLYINAVQAMDSGGKLDIRVSDVRQDAWVDIAVCDNGCGIDLADQDLVFDPYYTTRSSGTGLGLSIVHRIVENLSGHIGVESIKDNGSCFTISLPVYQKDEMI